MKEFLQAVQENLPIDFVTTHPYPTDYAWIRAVIPEVQHAVIRLKMILCGYVIYWQKVSTGC